MPKYSALVTLHARVEFEAPNDEAAIKYSEDRFDGHPQRVANLARLQHGWIGDDFDTIAIMDEDENTVMEV